jgi:hypothetical protein
MALSPRPSGTAARLINFDTGGEISIGLGGDAKGVSVLRNAVPLRSRLASAGPPPAHGNEFATSINFAGEPPYRYEACRRASRRRCSGRNTDGSAWSLRSTDTYIATRSGQTSQ